MAVEPWPDVHINTLIGRISLVGWIATALKPGLATAVKDLPAARAHLASVASQGSVAMAGILTRTSLPKPPPPDFRIRGLTRHLALGQTVSPKARVQ